MTPPVFRADLEGARSRELEGLTLLFHARSGLTHILAPPSPQILAVLGEGAATANALLARLAQRFDLDEADAAAAVAARLAELEEAGLVARA